jgi:AcrR family transcriptional regulator
LPGTGVARTLILVATVSGNPPVGLRERKKQRTRQAIVETATRLFAERGFGETTLAEVADEAEVALSTIFNYFPGKPDIVFAVLDALIESARARIVDRSEDEMASVAVLAWVREVLPELEKPYTEAIRRSEQIIRSDPDLVAAERLRSALLEDELALGFARDLGEDPPGVRSRMMAAISLGGMVDVWNDWIAMHRGDADLDFVELNELKAEYLEKVLVAGLEAVEMLPSPR